MIHVSYTYARKYQRVTNCVRSEENHAQRSSQGRSSHVGYFVAGSVEFEGAAKAENQQDPNHCIGLPIGTVNVALILRMLRMNSLALMRQFGRFIASTITTTDYIVLIMISCDHYY